MADACPCGSGRAFDACCGPLLAGGEAATAEALMRSRFTAFARRDAAHLIRTSDPIARTRLRPGDFRAAFAHEWTRLEILAVVRGGAGDADGVVRFRAHYRLDGAAGVLGESSRFARSRGAWYYRDAAGPAG